MDNAANDRPLSVEEEALAEVQEELRDEAKRSLKESFRKIARAKEVVANLEREHEALVRSLAG